MDIQKIIGDLVSKLTGNKDLIAQFTKDPLGAIKELLGIDLDKDQLDAVVKGNPVHRPENPTGSTYSSTTGLSPLKQRERQAEFPSSDKTRPNSPLPTLQGP